MIKHRLLLQLLCESYPQGSKGKRIRKRFATKGEATAFERYTMNEIDDKPWLGGKEDNRRLSELLDLWWKLHAKNLKSGANALRTITFTRRRFVQSARQYEQIKWR